MSFITLKCKNCGSNMNLNTESHSATCIHCGSTFLISDLLDEKDIAFTEKFTPKNLEQKMMAQGALKQGETYLFQAEYEKAELSFKRAIELDEENFKGYLGVVKAKTHNLNYLPENDDYLQYAHYALGLAPADELAVVKAELSKIDLLKTEKNRQKKIISANKKQEEKIRTQKQSVTKIISLISIFIVLMFGVFIFISTAFSSFIFSGDGSRKTININSYETLQKVFSSKKYLNYEINLTSDIDCGNNTLSPLGDETNPFTGIFNGNNHTLSNATITPSEKNKNANYVGLFGYTILAKINNLILDKVNLSLTTANSSEKVEYVGLIAGKIDSTTISSIEIKNSCYIDVSQDLNYNLNIGGLVGTSSNSSHISNISCHPSINLTLNENLSPSNVYAGAVIGTCSNSIFQKTCSNGTIYASISNNSYTIAKVFFGGIAGTLENISTNTISNYKNNFFSGMISVISKNLTSKISAITHTDIRATSKLNNYFLYTPTSFSTNNISLTNEHRLSYSELDDYLNNYYFSEVCISNDKFMNNFTSVFSDWKNSQTFTPSLV